MLARVFALLAISPMATACAPVERSSNADPAVGAPAVRVVGAPESCINRTQIRQSVVRNDRVIDFETRGGTVYRSTLPDKCPGLGIERAITYNTSIDQLCSAQIVYVLQQIGGVVQQGAACNLGPFVPVEYVKQGQVER